MKTGPTLAQVPGACLSLRRGAPSVQNTSVSTRRFGDDEGARVAGEGARVTGEGVRVAGEGRRADGAAAARGGEDAAGWGAASALEGHQSMPSSGASPKLAGEVIAAPGGCCADEDEGAGALGALGLAVAPPSPDAPCLAPCASTAAAPPTSGSASEGRG